MGTFCGDFIGDKLEIPTETKVKALFISATVKHFNQTKQLSHKPFPGLLWYTLLPLLFSLFGVPSMIGGLNTSQ